MPSRQIIKRRIKSVRNTRQITKAMQMVAASKLRRAQEAALGPQAYAAAARELLTNLSGQPVVKRHPLLAKREGNRGLLILVAGDRGLAGGYNSNIIRALGRRLRELGLPEKKSASVPGFDLGQDRNQLVIAIGKRAATQVAHASNLGVLATFEVDVPDVTGQIVAPILAEIRRLYDNDQLDFVELVTTNFISTVNQQVTTTRLLPVEIPEGTAPQGDAEMEPEPEELVDAAIKRILTAELTQAVLEARAAEQAARMLAMMNATDNADDIIDDLTLLDNNQRQAGITQQIAEISGGAEAMAST